VSWTPDRPEPWTHATPRFLVLEDGENVNYELYMAETQLKLLNGQNNNICIPEKLLQEAYTTV